MTWQPIDTAPTTGVEFLAFQEGEIYVARFTEEAKPRLCFRTHTLFESKHYANVEIDFKGERVEALVPINQPWKEVFEHSWTIWTRGFGFQPTHWAPSLGKP